MRFGMMAAVGMLAVTAGMAHGERENRGLSPIIMDVPYVPPREVPIVFAQAAAPAIGAPSQADYIFNACTETQSLGDPRAAWRAVNPAGMLATYIGNRDNRLIDMSARATIKLTLVEGSSHGKLNPHTTSDGRLYYMYEPSPDYEGDDRAVFLAEFEGKVYKIVVVIKVLFVIDQNSSQCDVPRLIKVKKPNSGSSNFGLDGVTVSFSDMAANHRFVDHP